MEGTLRIGAVNCAEDPVLCQSQNVMAYPSLVVFPQRIFYRGERSVDSLVAFISAWMPTKMYRLDEQNINETIANSAMGWVLEYCREGAGEDSDCSSILERWCAATTASIDK